MRLVDRFWSRVDTGSSSNCWQWQGSIKANGYGQIGVPGETQSAYTHRVAWLLVSGEWPDDMVLHTCDNKACVNPRHLYLGDRLDNAQDAVDRRLHPVGEDANKSDLTASDVKEIREKAGDTTQSVLAEEYGVSQTAISKIVRCESWQHI